VADHTCDINFCSTKIAVDNLTHEGRGESAVLVGDVMIDCALNFAEIAEKHYHPLEKHGLKPGNYALMTCHRAENTDNPSRLAGIVSGVNHIAKELPVIYPIHPRTRAYLEEYNLEFTYRVQVILSVTYIS